MDLKPAYNTGNKYFWGTMTFMYLANHQHVSARRGKVSLNAAMCSGGTLHSGISLEQDLQITLTSEAMDRNPWLLVLLLCIIHLSNLPFGLYFG